MKNLFLRLEKEENKLIDLIEHRDLEIERKPELGDPFQDETDQYIEILESIQETLMIIEDFLNPEDEE